MKKDQDFSRLLKKLNSRIEIQDKEALWNELEPRLPKQKKRRYPFVFWFGSGLIALSVAFIIWYDVSSRQTLQSENYGDDQASLIAHDVHGFSQSAQASNRVEEKTTLKEINPIKNGEPAGAAPSKTSATYRQDTDQSNFISKQKIDNDIINKSNSPNQTILESSRSNPELLSDYHNKSKELNYNLAPSINVKFELNDPRNKIGESSLVIQNKNGPSNGLSQPVNIENLSFLPVNINPLTIESNNITIEGSIADALEPQESNPWKVYISTYATGLTNSKSQNPTSEYGERLNDLSDIKLGYSIGFQGGVRKSNGLRLSIGAERTILFDKFRLNESISTEEQVTNPAAFRHNGALISKDEVITRTINQNVLNYNQFTQWSILPMIGYSIDKDVIFRFSAAPMFNLSKTYDGFLVDEDNKLIDVPSDLFSNQKFSYSGYMLTSSISKNITPNIDLGLNLIYQNRSNNTSENNEHFNIGIKSLGVGFLMTYTFQ